MKKLDQSFFARDTLTVATDILGKDIIRNFKDGSQQRFMISEVEAYCGEEDLACHASKGRTQRTEVMYWKGGFVYVYLIYGIHYLLNFVTGTKDDPQAILIRGVNEIVGPGRVSKLLQIDKTFNKTNLFNSDEIWIEDSGIKLNYTTESRVGIDYAGNYWKNKPWRFIAVGF